MNKNCVNCKFSYEEECWDAPCHVYKCIFGEGNCIIKQIKENKYDSNSTKRRIFKCN